MKVYVRVKYTCTLSFQDKKNALLFDNANDFNDFIKFFTTAKSENTFQQDGFQLDDEDLKKLEKEV